MIRRRRRWLAPAAVVLASLAVPGAVLAQRAWTIAASPLVIAAGATSSITLDVQNVGGSGGGDEITCVIVEVPAAFAVSAATIIAVKGETSAAAHGWETTRAAAGGQTTIAFQNPGDDNPLVGLPVGDRATFRVTGVAPAPGLISWTAVAYDKPGGGGDLDCGSGTFPTLQVLLTVVATTATPTPAPTPTPTPAPTPTPVPTATPAPSPTPTARPAATPTPTPRPTPTRTPLPTPPPQPSTPTPAPSPSESPPAPASDAPAPASATPTASGSGGPASAPPTARPSDPPAGSPSPDVATFVVGAGGDGGPGGAGGPDGDGGARRTATRNFDAAVTATLLELGLEGWTVPAFALGVPGLLVVLGVLLQLLGGAAWVPIARRSLAGVGGVRPQSRVRPPTSGSSSAPGPSAGSPGRA